MKGLSLDRKANIQPDDIEIKAFRSVLFRWYRRNGRSYPWRDDCSPFHVLLAEMMLQRTKADQVVPIFLKTVRRFPTPMHLAKAALDELGGLLQPLGLSWRIPNFKEMAHQLVERYEGIVPESREELISLPGVGDYIAGAVLAIAFNKPEWVVDSNIVRVFRRYFGIKTTAEGRRDLNVIEIAKKYISRRKPRASALAILDFTALICIPSYPRCGSCPFKSGCKYFLNHHFCKKGDDLKYFNNFLIT